MVYKMQADRLLLRFNIPILHLIDLPVRNVNSPSNALAHTRV